MREVAGYAVPLSLPRRLICDMLHFARQVPSVPVERRMQLGAVAAARQALVPRPSWAALFTKAYGLVTAARAELRRSFLSFPRAHLYQHVLNKATVAVERSFGQGEQAVFFVPVKRPEASSLADLDRRLRRYKTAPPESVRGIRRALAVCRLPSPVRRLLWWSMLNVFGEKRGRYVGTFGVSAYSGLGATSLHPLSVTPTTLTYGVVEPEGAVDVRIIYDHRVLDGATVARALAELEEVLHLDILKELRGLGESVVQPAEEPLLSLPKRVGETVWGDTAPASGIGGGPVFQTGRG
jgi:hypothetical protein